MTDIDEEDIDWLWRPYLPKNELCGLIGRGGMGKSFLTIQLAARFSRGDTLPGEGDERNPGERERAPMRVLMLSAEDDYSKVIKPRLRAAGADMRMIAVPNTLFTLDTDGIALVETYLQQGGFGVMTIDPVVYYAGGRMDMNKANAVRALMTQLASLGHKYKVTIILVGHVRKSQADDNQDAWSGSADWVNASRSVMLLAQTNEGTRIMKHVKTNYGELGPARTYTIDEGRFVFGETIDEDDVKLKRGRPSAERQKAEAFLRNVLANGPMAETELSALAKDEGIAPATLTRAKKGVVERSYSSSRRCFISCLIDPPPTTTLQ
ncbi:AAA family ATPase [Mesorhizobium sp. L-8-10]|uniref:AAA family ATPase n=1 Tax=Mesorhizobium sp. L-8-10 TaxID=2744523 RepID=UPI0019280E36|nr:AAA family ATPase [Mesorhizobium sp. L-8-10]